MPPIIVGDMGVWDAQSLQDAAARYPTELARSLESVSSTLLRQIDPDFAQLVAELRVRRVQIDGGEAVTVCCTPASRLLPAAARMHADLASAAPTSRLGVLLRMSPPTRIVDAAEFLIRILHATPADGIVTRAEARYIERVAALRASGVPIDPLRIDPWLRASDTPDLELLQQFEAIRATYGATRFSALRHALEGLQPMFLEMLLVVGAEPSAIVSRAEVARRRSGACRAESASCGTAMARDDRCCRRPRAGGRSTLRRTARGAAL
ncbi:MAG: hypothetical protein IPF98_22665 [Gemmatimonadetes bacterium]|nr:hypothetical protein [Gemmatimonadota bacterium]